jgi:hypothetical protein
MFYFDFVAYNLSLILILDFLSFDPYYCGDSRFDTSINFILFTFKFLNVKRGETKSQEISEEKENYRMTTFQPLKMLILV